MAGGRDGDHCCNYELGTQLVRDLGAKMGNSDAAIRHGPNHDRNLAAEVAEGRRCRKPDP